MRYLIVLSAGARRLSSTTFSCESAFVEHLRALKAELNGRFHELVVAMGEMSEAQYEAHKAGHSVVDEVRENIRFEPVFPWRSSKLHFALGSPRMLLRLARAVGEAAVLHSHLSYDLYRPVELAASLLGVAMNKKVITITDMDNRRDAEMNFRVGNWSRRTYLTCKYVYDPLRDVQQRAYVRLADLVLFKEPQQVDDYGKGAPHVRLFFDPNFTRDHIIDDGELAAKQRVLEDAERPLRVLYFGRLVAYKGVDRMLEAVARARSEGARLTFDVMGIGPEERRIKELVRTLHLDDIVGFLEPKPYGPLFFDVLRNRDLLLACPLAGDTPRSTWDALASGLPILAFDTPFYAGIGKLTGAVDVTPWPEVEPFATRLAELARNKGVLIDRMHEGVAAARANPGEDWLKRRVAWVEELFMPAERVPSLTRPSGSA